MSDRVRVRRALLSMADKTGLPELAGLLRRHGVDVLSTGGTAAALRAAGHSVQDVSDLTGFPDLLDGRVKTLHPAIHGGILADTGKPGHRAALRRMASEAIDLVAVSLYPFERSAAAGLSAADCIEQIDIGGPAMLRAAAKNHARVVVLPGAEFHPALQAEMDAHQGATSLAFRRNLAAEAFARTASYDAAIANWAQGRAGGAWPSRLLLSAELEGELRYGENPHQRAALYRGAPRPGAVHARLHQGKPLSCNNLADADAAFALAAEFPPADGAACVIVKHANPCGVAVRGTAEEACRAALAADPTSAFGGVLAFNSAVDAGAAATIAGRFFEVVIAPELTEAALSGLAARPSLRALSTGGLPDPGDAPPVMRPIAGGILVQEADSRSETPEEWRVVTRRAPEAAEMRDLEFAWRVVKHVKSNAVLLARARASVGVGAGQTSRVRAVEAAVSAAAEASDRAGLVMASDAFFPFPDGIETAAAAGVRAVVQPGGAQRDSEVIAAADAAGIGMLFTGVRHFRH